MFINTSSTPNYFKHLLIYLLCMLYNENVLHFHLELYPYLWIDFFLNIYNLLGVLNFIP